MTRTIALLLAAVLLGGVSRAQSPVRHGPADQPASRTDANSKIAHTQLLEKARKGASTSILKATQSRAAGARAIPNTRRTWPTGPRIFLVGTRLTSVGAPTGPRTFSGVWKMANWMESILKLS